MWFDTHCHLTSKRLRKDLESVVASAHAVGVQEIMVPGTSVHDSRIAVQIAIQNHDIYVSVGVHPSEILTAGQMDLAMRELEVLGREPKVVGIGEVGLDETMKVSMDVQEVWLQSQIELAKKFKKSLVLHNRGASDRLVRTLENCWSSLLSGRTVFHCAEADLKLLAFAKLNSVYIGVDGDVTYKQEKQDFIRQVPIELLVLETDAPYLLPEPLLAEKRYPNVPANLIYTARQVASLMGIDLETLARYTTRNAYRLFGLEE